MESNMSTANKLRSKTDYDKHAWILQHGDYSKQYVESVQIRGTDTEGNNHNPNLKHELIRWYKIIVT